jgi:hypothetical protein
MGAPISESRLDNQLEGQGRSASVDNVSADFVSTFGSPDVWPGYRFGATSAIVGSATDKTSAAPNVRS